MKNSDIIFLCHAKEDIEAVKNLHARLKKTGFNPWLDEIDILPGQNWDSVIRKTIKQAGFALICISKKSVQKRGYVKKEISWALDRQAEMLDDDIFLIVIKLEECELKDSLSDYQWCDLYKRDGFERLLKSLKYQLTKTNILNTTKNSQYFVENGQYLIEINEKGNTLLGTISINFSENVISMSDLKLDNSALVSIKKNQLKMGQIIKTFIQAESKDIYQFDESYQLDLGQYLLKQLFPEIISPPTNIDIHIRTLVDNLLLLPWYTLSHNRSFLSSLGWTVSLSGNLELSTGILPDNPKVLIVTPQPTGTIKTFAEAHLENLEYELSSRNHVFLFGLNLEVAYTWEEFNRKLKDFSPHVIYFYGHCSVRNGNSELCMALESRSDCHYITDKDLLFSIEKMDIKPVLLYLNCLNSSAGLINFGLTLSKKVSAFISSRFLYSFDVAQEQGIKLLLDILTKGNAPHRAVSDLFGKLDQSLNIATPQARWMTPLIFRQYSDWIATIPETPARRIHDPHWHLKIDRVSQISTVTFQTLQMLREGRPRCQAFVWYSTEGQGAEKFHHRLTIDLREYLLEFNADFCEVRPEWPSEFDRPEIAFKDCLIEAFMVKNLDDIPGAIRKMNYGTSGKQTLVYVRHIPVTSPRLINPKVLKYYLSWWDNTIIPLLERNQFALLGVSFIVKNPKKFRNLILQKERLEDLYLKNTVFRLLDELEQLANRDILDFFKTHKIHMPMKNRDKIIERILDKTEGHYENTVKELQVFVEQSWDLHEYEELQEQATTDDYDY